MKHSQKKFPHARAIVIDGSKIPMDKPRNAIDQSAMSSDYKNRNTLNVMAYLRRLRKVCQQQEDGPGKETIPYSQSLRRVTLQWQIVKLLLRICTCACRCPDIYDKHGQFPLKKL